MRHFLRPVLELAVGLLAVVLACALWAAAVPR